MRVLVTVDNFRIEATEVTNADYAQFLAAAVATSSQPPECAFNIRFAPEQWPVSANQSRLPVVGIDHCDAAAFCRWSGRKLCGSRLDGGADSYSEPANVQLSAWVFACTAGGNRTYGFDGPFSAGRCNVSASAPTGTRPPLEPVASRAGCDAGFGGLFDLTGNAWEWVDACDKQTGGTDRCRLRGGSAESGLADSVCGYDLVTTRGGGWEYVGFRCCAE